MTKQKRKSNNPHGRPEVADKKAMIGIYVRQSDIIKYGGKDGIRAKIKQVLALKD